MPIYPYQCLTCGSAFEQIHGWKESPGPCPDCGSTKLERQIPTRIGIVTDKTWKIGRHTLAQQFPNDVDRVIRNAKRRGFKPHYTDIYDPCLALKPSDPAAFIPNGEGRSYAKKVAERQGMAGPPRPVKPRVKLAEPIVRSIAKQWIRKDPSWKQRPAELRQAILNKHARKPKEE